MGSSGDRLKEREAIRTCRGDGECVAERGRRASGGIERRGECDVLRRRRIGERDRRRLGERESERREPLPCSSFLEKWGFESRQNLPILSCQTESITK